MVAFICKFIGFVLCVLDFARLIVSFFAFFSLFGGLFAIILNFAKQNRHILLHKIKIYHSNTSTKSKIS